MTIERRIAAVFRLDDETWCHHANPWSVVLRDAALPAAHPRILEPALARVVGARPGGCSAALDLAQSRASSRRPGPSTTGTRRACSGSASGSTATPCLSRPTTAGPRRSSRPSAVSGCSSSPGACSRSRPGRPSSARPSSMRANLVPRPHGLALARHAGRAGEYREWTRLRVRDARGIPVPPASGPSLPDRLGELGDHALREGAGPSSGRDSYTTSRALTPAGQFLVAPGATVRSSPARGLLASAPGTGRFSAVGCRETLMGVLHRYFRP